MLHVLCVIALSLICVYLVVVALAGVLAIGLSTTVLAIFRKALRTGTWRVR